jgi:hypothetical protein
MTERYVQVDGLIYRVADLCGGHVAYPFRNFWFGHIQ